MSYFKDSGALNESCVSPFSDPLYEAGIANIEDLIKQLQLEMAASVKAAGYILRGLQIITTTNNQIILDPAIGLQIIPVITDGGPKTTADITFKNLDNTELKEGTSVRVVGMSDTDIVILKAATAIEDGIKSPGNVPLGKFFSVEFYYLNNANTTKGWIRSAKSP